MGPIKVFSLDAGAEFAGEVAAELGVSVAAHEQRDFTDGEHKLRPLDDVEGADVYLVQSLYSDPPGAAGGSVDDKLVRVLFFLAALRDAGAARLTAVIPYLCYARKDRRTKLRDPLSSRYLASLLEAMGSDCVVTIDVHNLAAFENAFRCRTLNLPARPLFLDYAVELLRDESRGLVVVSPDVGGVKRAEAFRADLAERLGRDVGQAFVEKYRSADQLSGGTLVGEVRDRCALVIDDLIAGGGTIERATGALHRAGAARILALASHGQFAGDALQKLAALPLEAVAVTDSLPQAGVPRLNILRCAPLLAEAIRRLHDGGPAIELSL
ncbi:ribose-phosphate diphosphokinase [Microbulbifer yueqingensis]|uniref:ribose-phosphate diphosphokinase n=1 Tax=Microbulbifer yueqingensis TaxID=658219 RepID=A0A1G9BZJ2_9GAMM|nr:ribose-phosphate pyrophosphokinase [Microbulbifer yueqingensis]SDK44773.1 ribose-phosphate pyrophosphokinase [Microbulbifer yueqingensis]